MNYRWEKNFWDLGYIPELKFYTVAGPLAQWSSWQLEASLQHKDLIRLNFTEADNPAFFGAGWGSPEISPQGQGVRWVTGHRAELMLPLPKESAEDAVYQLNLEIWVPEFNSGQSISMQINGHGYADRPLEPGMHLVIYRIPAEHIVSGDNHIVLDFAQSNRASEEDLRSLTVSMKTVYFERMEVGS
jgi:hypothetical protein